MDKEVVNLWEMGKDEISVVVGLEIVIGLEKLVGWNGSSGGRFICDWETTCSPLRFGSVFEKFSEMLRSGRYDFERSCKIGEGRLFTTDLCCV